MIIRKPKRLGIRHYSHNKEIGGLIIGKWIDKKNCKWRLKNYLQLRNESKTPESDYLPARFSLIKRLRILWYVMTGWEVMGTWHSHIKGKLTPSRKDVEAVRKIAKGGIFILGIAGDDITLNNHGVEVKQFKIKNYIFNIDNKNKL